MGWLLLIMILYGAGIYWASQDEGRTWLMRIYVAIVPVSLVCFYGAKVVNF